MVYLAIKHGEIVYRTDKNEMKKEGITKPEIEMTDEEFKRLGGFARIISGKIVVGKTTEEAAEEDRQDKIKKCLAELESIDSEAGAKRSVRGLALAAGVKAGLTETEDYKRLHKIEERAEPLRLELDRLKKIKV
jgi:hypothetical protein